MLKVKVDSERVDLKASGGIAQIVTDMATAIAAITASLMEHQDTKTGEAVIRQIMTAGCAAGLKNGIEKSRRRKADEHE